MGAIREAYPDIPASSGFGLGEDDQYHIMDVFGGVWCENQVEYDEGILAVVADEEPSTIEVMCSTCLRSIQEEE